MEFFTFTEIITFAGVLLSVCSAVTVVINARKAINELTQPFRDLVKRVEQLEEYASNDYERFKEQDEKFRLVLKCEMQIMQHMIDGNHVHKMKETKAEVEEYLVRNS